MRALKTFFSTIYWIGYAICLFVEGLWKHGFK